LNQKTTTLLNSVGSYRGTRRAAAFLAGLMMALAVPASASTIGIDNGVLILGAEPGDGNQEFKVIDAGPNLAFPNLDAEIVTPGCFELGGQTIECQKIGLAELVIIGGDGDDLIDVSDIFNHDYTIVELGGSGNDRLIGGDGDDRLYGGAGDDVFLTTPNNCVSTGTGNDTVFGSPRVCGGPEPDFKPLPRQTVAATPEAGGVWLLGSALAALVVTGRITSRRGV